MAVQQTPGPEGRLILRAVEAFWTGAKAVKYQIAIFDFDGTLADSAQWFFHAVNKLSGEYGFKQMNEQECDRLRGWTSQEIIQYLQVPMWKIPRIMARLRIYAAQDRDRIALFPGITEALENLHGKGVQTAVVSSNSEPTIRHVLGPANAARISHFAGGASMFGKAGKLRTILRRTGMKPADAIYIGDETRDGTAARQAGLAFGAVSWGYAKLEALIALEPDLVFTSPAQIAQKLTRT